ncbi:hypothetical protein HA402_008768 [Bradysia odoriphaga]|nr:hypothetical protein HA402_008768 [Bradysia odoriphaga]
MESSVKPIDEEVPTICQFNMEKKDLMSASDSDDEIQMWVEKPVVIDLTCDESTPDCSHANVKEVEMNLNDPKVIEIKSDNDLGNLGSCPSQDPVNASTEDKSCTLLLDFINVATSTFHPFRIRTVESLYQDLLIPHATSPVNSTTSSENVLPSHHAVNTNHHVTVPGGTTPAQSEPKHETNNHATKKRSRSSERIDNESKKIKLRSCDRFYDASASRFIPKKKDDDRQTFATPINPKSDSLSSETNQQRGHSRRRRSRFDNYENSHHSRNLVHPGNTSSTSTHQQATEKYAKPCEENSHSGQNSSSTKIKTDAWSNEHSNASNQKNKHSRLSEYQRSCRLSVDDNFHNSESSRRSRFRSRSPIYQREIVENGKTAQGHRYSSAHKKSSSQTVWDPSACYTNSNDATRMNKYSEASEIQRSPPTRDKSHWESISLTKDRCRPLLSNLNGFNFLNDVYDTYGIIMKLTWVPNITLHFRGTKLQRTRFRGDLAMFIDNEIVNNGIKSAASASNGFELKSQACDRFVQNLPRCKSLLIKMIEDNLDLLQTNLGNAEALFAYITTKENKQSKISMKQVNRSRKDLNIILMGQAGLRDGPKHLAELKRLLKTLKNINESVINKAFIATITPHFNYIFTSYQHDDYPALIAEYKMSLKTNRSTNDLTEASNSSDGPAQVSANMPIEGAHQTVTSDTIEASNSCDGPAKVPVNMAIEVAHQTVTSDTTEASNSCDGLAPVPANMPIEGAHQTVTSDTIEASNSSDAQLTTTSCATDSSTQPSMEGAHQVVAGN